MRGKDLIGLLADSLQEKFLLCENGRFKCDGYGRNKAKSFDMRKAKSEQSIRFIRFDLVILKGGEQVKNELRVAK